MYNSYISSTLDSCNIKIIEFDLNIDRVLSGCILIAKEMFKKKTLEVNIDIYNERENNMLEVVEILRYSRIGRINNNIFSFSHRRIMEFFYVCFLIESNDNIELESIPSDSQSRDALVLYCQIADKRQAEDVANYCWQFIIQSENLKNREVLHCIRFLNDAYIGRKECLEKFQSDLAELINKQVDKSNDMLMFKLSLEAVGLLSNIQIDEVISKALKIGNYWTNDTAIKSCRHLPNISENLEHNLYDYIVSLEYINLDFYNKFSDLYFSFSLSDAFRRMKLILILKIIDFIPNFLLSALPSITTLFFFSISEKKQPKNFETNFSEYLLISLMFVGFLWRMHYPFLVAIYSRKTATKFVKFILILFTIPIAFLFIILTFVFFSYISKKYKIISTIGEWFLNIIGPVFLLLVVIGLTTSAYTTIRNFVSDYFLMRRVIIKKLTNRSEIYSLFIKIRTNFYKNKYVSRLENEVVTVNGDWPDSSFLNLSHDSRMIRLAKLDEKWQKLDR